MHTLIKKFNSFPGLLKKKYQSRQNVSRLKRITDAVNPINAAHAPGPRILLGPSFPIYHAQKLHDILCASALAARGATVAYTAAPYGLPICHDCANIAQFLKTDAPYCQFCQRFQRNEANMIEYLEKFSTIYHPSAFVSQADLSRMTDHISSLSEKELYGLSQDGLPLISYALDALRNLRYVGNEKLLPDYLAALRAIAAVQMIYVQYFKKAIETFQPDIILCYDAFYSPWQVLYGLATQRGIPFYNNNPGQRDNTWHYDKDRVSMLLEIDELFAKWKSKKIKESELAQLDMIFAHRKKGKIYRGTNVWKESRDEQKKFDALIGSGKPIAALYSNVLWDLASLNREIVFHSVQETFWETVRFFIRHPQYNLVIKPHPDELHATHEAREKMTDLIRAEFPTLPDNIMILYPKSSITAYDLIPRTRVTIVYTTTVGIESAILKTPTIVLGNIHYRNKGFTYDPKTPEEYFRTLETLLQSRDEKNLEIQRELARKYLYLLYFVYWHNYDIIKYDMKGKNVIMPKNLNALLAKKDFMKVIDAIMRNQPVPYFDEGIEQPDN